jgi:phosphoribosylanthranilate isomerase
MSSTTKIKVCGLTRKQDVELAAELGAWALGFIFYEKSPRAVSPALVQNLTRDVNSKTRKVGVFVNEKLDSIQYIVESSGINTIQLHGDESVSLCEEIRNLLPHVELIKAFRPKTFQDLREIQNYQAVTHGTLIDSFSTTARGGTGIVVDWNLATRAQTYGPIILAGGLHPENVQEALITVRPDALDVSSGLEISPGVKCEDKMRRFFQNVQSQNSPMRLK